MLVVIVYTRTGDYITFRLRIEVHNCNILMYAEKRSIISHHGDKNLLYFIKNIASNTGKACS